MGKNKYCSYENARSYLYDKDRYINSYIDMMFNRTQKMFKWDNLPETIPQRELEYILQKNGSAFISEVHGKIYALSGTVGGELNEYYEPTKYIVANPYLNLNREYKIDVDGVLIRNDSRSIGLLPIFSKASVMNCDCEITLNMLSILLRMQYMISASDDKTRTSAETYINKLKNGDFSVVGTNEFFDGVKLQTLGQNINAISEFINLSQYIKASAFNDIGLNANFNMKKERLITSEIAVNESALLPLVENMEQERKNAVEKINAMFSTDIDVNLSCVWKEQAETHEIEPTEINDELESVDKTSENIEELKSADETSERRKE